MICRLICQKIPLKLLEDHEEVCSDKLLYMSVDFEPYGLQIFHRLFRISG